ncbi:hypothetical protein AVI51_10995 [Piscirickettsia salmonis]|uniref:Uncharacterized protein n=1 Tax=Piscirickettsia salmonis TaxID=1238 RepID=A0A9Q5VAH5_PISSA|nr:hypothetical protein [Piscirickettsia salmonis]ALA26460.1 plasmid recombination protein [Piscirickettsia salmonis]APS43881.1 hypothetical protein AVI48_05505 [Piscirickettsia salmonis]APS47235.1 hypothetical protein AVI49_06105 [Piscirickettsia salmonis]APS51327.1 hypothetical protein AVI50_11110 [Piscirickettsia salmonis]APS54535.1 hypothetical protein AVI51_10995 [Piscirickettsia salmonis]
MDAIIAKESEHEPVDWLGIETFSRKGGRSKASVADCLKSVELHAQQGQVLLGELSLLPLLEHYIEDAKDRLGRKLSQSALVLLRGKVIYPSQSIDTQHFDVNAWSEQALNFLQHEYQESLRLVLLVGEALYFYAFPDCDEQRSFSLADCHRGLRAQELVDRSLTDYRKQQRHLMRVAMAELNQEYVKAVLSSYSIMQEGNLDASHGLVYSRQSLIEQVSQIEGRLQKLNDEQCRLTSALAVICVDVKRYQHTLLAYEHLLEQKKKIEGEVQIVSNRVKSITKEDRSFWGTLSYFLAVLAGNSHTIKEERSLLAELFRELNAVDETLHNSEEQLKKVLHDQHQAIVWAKTQQELDKDPALEGVYNRFRQLQYYQAKLKRDERQCQQRANQLQRALQVLSQQMNKQNESNGLGEVG